MTGKTEGEKARERFKRRHGIGGVSRRLPEP